jgi:hypothetical protein
MNRRLDDPRDPHEERVAPLRIRPRADAERAPESGREALALREPAHEEPKRDPLARRFGSVDVASLHSRGVLTPGAFSDRRRGHDALPFVIRARVRPFGLLAFAAAAGEQPRPRAGVLEGQEQAELPGEGLRQVVARPLARRSLELLDVMHHSPLVSQCG